MIVMGVLIGYAAVASILDRVGQVFIYCAEEHNSEVDPTRTLSSRSCAQCRFLGGQHSGVQDCPINNERLQNKLRTVSVNRHKNLILLLVALLAPEFVGFQHLEWWLPGSSHSTFIVSSFTWQVVLSIRCDLAYSDWFSGFGGALNGWLLLPNLFTHAMPGYLFSFLMASAVHLNFVAAVALYRQDRIGKSILIIASVLLVGLSIATCVSSTTPNVIYGIPPGVFVSILAPDVDTKLMLPIPILLIAGLLLSKRPNLSDAEAQMEGLDRI